MSLKNCVFCFFRIRFAKFEANWRIYEFGIDFIWNGRINIFFRARYTFKSAVAVNKEFITIYYLSRKSLKHPNRSQANYIKSLTLFKKSGLNVIAFELIIVKLSSPIVLSAKSATAKLSISLRA